MHTPNPPIGLAYIAGALREAEIAFTVIDATGSALDEVHPYPDRKDFLLQGLSLEQIVAEIPEGSDIIGVGCMFSTLWPITSTLIGLIKEAFPDAQLILGGEHGTAVYEDVLTNSACDIVVLGEGEETFLRTISAIRGGTDLSEVAGIAYRADDEIVSTGLSARQRSVDDIARPDWDAFPIRNYIDRDQMNGLNMGRSMPLLATRGCPYRCTFCSNPGMWTQRWIAREPKLVVDEMEAYIQTYQVTNFDFQDLTAIVNRRWVLEFCAEINRRGLNITWQMPSGTRTEVFDDEVAKALYGAGCRVLAFAPESGSETLLKQVEKKVDLDRMEVAVRAALRNKLKLACFFVIGFPGETRETLKETLRLARKLAVIGVHDLTVAKFIPYPGSQLFRELQAQGKIKLDNEFFVSPMDFYSNKAESYVDGLTTKQLHSMMLWIYFNFYIISFVIRPFRVARILAKVLFQGVEETRYAKWFVDIVFVRRRWRNLSKA